MKRKAGSQHRLQYLLFVVVPLAFVAAAAFAQGTARTASPALGGPTQTAAGGELRVAVVRDTDGKPVAGAAVSLAPEEGGRSRKATAGADGVASFRSLAEGRWTVSAGATGLLNRTEWGIEVVAGPSAAAVEIRLQRGGEIAGAVRDEAGAPVAGALVESGDRKTKTGADGRYRLTGLAPGLAAVSVSAPRFVRTVLQGAQIEDEKSFSAPDCVLQPAGRVRGRITDAESGKPLAGAEIYFYGEDIPGGSWGSAKTDARGEFLVDGLQAGTHSFNVSREGYEFQSGGGVVTLQGESIEIAPLTLRLRPPAFALYANQKTFRPGERPKIYFNAFRAQGFTVQVRRLALENALGAAGFVGEPRTLLGWAAGPAVARIPTQTISYRRVLTDVHGRGLNLPALPRGFYLVEAVADGGALTDWTWIQVTDLAAIAKETHGDLLIYATSLETGVARPGIEVVRYDGGPHRLGTTGAQGLLRIEKPAAFKASVILAKDAKTGDAALLHAGGRTAPERPALWRAYLETDRPIYRPGHTVFFKGTVRGDDKGIYSIRAPASATLRVADSNDGVLLEQDVKLRASGSFDGSIELPSNAPLGFYSMALELREKDGGEADPAALEGGSFRVEEYRKPEFKVAVALAPAWVLGGEPLTATIDASYYFGGPVGGAAVRWTVYADPFWGGALFPDEAPCADCWTGWDSSAWGEGGYGRLVASGQAATDAAGRALVKIATRRPKGNDERYRVVVSLADPTGREVEDTARALVTRAGFALSVDPDRYVVSPGEAFAVTVRAADFGGKPVATPFVLRTLLDVWEKGKSTSTLLGEIAGATDAAGRATLTLTPARSGSLRLYALAKDGGGNLTDETAWVYAAREGSELTAGAGGPARSLDIVTDKKSYRPGETARVLIQAPVAGPDALFTVEGEAIGEARVLRLAGTSALIELPVTSGHLPTLHLAATLVAGGRLHRAERALPVAPDEKILKVRVTPDREVYRPRERMKLAVETLDERGAGVPAEVSVAVVDEAIFALSRELTPDVRLAFYGARPNRVQTTHSFPFFYEGGADKFDASQRRSLFKDTALWSPFVETDASGRAAVEVELPDNLTTWRATARAISPATAVGQARSTAVARKDLMVRLGTPRFFVEGDTVRLRGAIHNETATPLTVRTRLVTDGLDLLAPSEATYEIGAKSVLGVDLPLRVARSGEVSLTWDAVAPAAQGASGAAGQTLADGVELKLPAKPYGTLEVATKSGATTDRASFELPLAAEARDARMTVRVAPSLAAGLYDALDRLDTYPYGCIEQTVNGFVPATIVRQAFENLGLENLNELAGIARDDFSTAFRGQAAAWWHPHWYDYLAERLPERIERGLERLRDLQHEDGGWGWWEHDPSHPFLTAYAVFGMALAREAGEAIYEDDLEEGRAALVKFLAGPDADADPDVQAWVLFALARSGELTADLRQAAIALDAEPATLSPHARALITSVMARVAPERAEASARALLALAVRGPGDATLQWPVPEKKLYTWVGSDVEATAYAALAILEAMPRGEERDRAAEAAIRFLVQNRRGAWWTTTKDTAAALLATTAWLAERPGEMRPDYRVGVSVNGASIGEEHVEAGHARAFLTPVAVDATKLKPGANAIEVEKRKDRTKLKRGEPKPKVYYTASLESVLAKGVESPVRNGFTVERQYYRLRLEKGDEGWKRVAEPYDPEQGPLTAGDRVEVHLKVKADRDWAFVMVEDPLPSGFEVEDAFGRDDDEWSELEWNWWFAKRQVRDDRVVFFATRWPQADEPGNPAEAQEFVYTLRAEVAGEKHVLPATASLMYFPEIRGASAGMRLQVAPRP